MGLKIGVLAAEHIAAGAVERNAIAGAIRRFPDHSDKDYLAEMPAEEIAQHILEEIQFAREGQPVEAIGVGFPGIIREGVIEESPNLPQLKGQNFGVLLGGLLAQADVSATVHLLNDADAMAAGIATLEVLRSERLIERADALGKRLIANFSNLIPRHELFKDVRGKGLMIGIEFGAPRSLKLRATWAALQAMNSELFCQIIIIPLFKDHKILSQVAGHGIQTIKVQPALTITDADCAWMVEAFDRVIADAHRGPAAALSLGRTLVDNAMRARATA